MPHAPHNTDIPAYSDNGYCDHLATMDTFGISQTMHHKIPLLRATLLHGPDPTGVTVSGVACTTDERTEDGRTPFFRSSVLYRVQLSRLRGERGECTGSLACGGGAAASLSSTSLFFLPSLKDNGGLDAEVGGEAVRQTSNAIGLEGEEGKEVSASLYSTATAAARSVSSSSSEGGLVVVFSGGGLFSRRWRFIPFSYFLSAPPAHPPPSTTRTILTFLAASHPFFCLSVTHFHSLFRNFTIHVRSHSILFNAKMSAPSSGQRETTRSRFGRLADFAVYLEKEGGQKMMRMKAKSVG